MKTCTSAEPPASKLDAGHETHCWLYHDATMADPDKSESILTVTTQ
jgi:hypothetical protein